MGITLREVIFDIGEELEMARSLKLFKQVVFGGCLTEKHLDSY
jgi:hypothetical protein